MSDEENKKDETFWEVIGSFFAAISMRVKVVAGALLGLFGLISYFLFKTKRNDREILELELKKVREEIEIEIVQKDIDSNNERLETLRLRADEIVEEIKNIEKPDPEREVSKEELDDFFDKRGF